MKRSYRRSRRNEKSKIKEFRINNAIRAERVLFIDNEGKTEEVDLATALSRAREAELDLVEVSPVAKPPVVRAMDYGKYKYQQEKQIRKQKSAQKKTETKGIRLSPRIGKHDLEVRRKQALKFLEKGAKVKIELVLRGREHHHVDLAKKIVQDFIDSIEAEITVEQPVIKQGHAIQSIIAKKV